MDQKDKQPLVSVIVPIYNTEQYLDTCVCALLAQIYTYIEIILVMTGVKMAVGRCVMNMPKKTVVYGFCTYRMVAYLMLEIKHLK